MYERDSFNPLEGLTRGELERELDMRGHTATLDSTNMTKKDMELYLQKQVRGSKRLPPLATRGRDPSMKDLQNYEVSGFEPLHDYCGDVENILNELPYHLDEQTRKVMQSTLDYVWGSRKNKRGCDYRRAMCHLPSVMFSVAPSSVNKLLAVTAEIGAIVYGKSHKRSPRRVLRLHILTWKSHLLKRQVLLSERIHGTSKAKIPVMGKYHHNLVAHAPILYRLLPTSSLYTEQEEKSFNTIKNIAQQTSNMKTTQMLSNTLLRMEIEEEQQYLQSSATDSEISLIHKSQNVSLNTIITENDILSNKREWWCLCQRIADFLVQGEGVWFNTHENGAIEFKDSESEPDVRSVTDD